MIRAALLILTFLAITQLCSAQNDTPKYYCPPCDCEHDGKLFDKPGVCPDPQCNMQLLPVEGDYRESKLRYIVTFLRNSWLIRLYDILILPAIIQGFILSLILIFRGYANRQASVFLALLIVALSLQNIKFYYILYVLVDYITNTGGNPDYNIDSLGFPFSGVLFIGPALYFYVCSLTSGEFRFAPRHIIHFAPGFVFMVINALVFYKLVGDDVAHSFRVNFAVSNSFVENIVAIGLAFNYIYLSVRLMNRHELWVYDHFSTSSRKSLKWLRNLIVALSLVWFIWLFSVVINFFTGDFVLTYLSSYPFQIVTCIIIFWVGYVGFIQGEIFSLEISFERKIDLLKSVSKKEEQSNEAIRRAIIKAMEVDRLFLIPDLSLATLSSQLNLSPKSISQALNHDLKKNFYDFVNEYRVEEVKKRLRNPAYNHLTILAIALESGFNSKSSFNRIFMKAAGMSPKEYKASTQQMQAEQAAVSES